jgi:hypothetical protein
MIVSTCTFLRLLVVIAPKGRCDASRICLFCSEDSSQNARPRNHKGFKIPNGSLTDSLYNQCPSLELCICKPSNFKLEFTRSISFTGEIFVILWVRNIASSRISSDNPKRRMKKSTLYESSKTLTIALHSLHCSTVESTLAPNRSALSLR